MYLLARSSRSRVSRRREKGDAKDWEHTDYDIVVEAQNDYRDPIRAGSLNNFPAETCIIRMLKRKAAESDVI